MIKERENALDDEPQLNAAYLMMRWLGADLRHGPPRRMPAKLRNKLICS